MDFYLASVLTVAVVWLVLTGLAIWSFDGLWRKAALVPVVIMGLAVLVAALGVIAGSNLAPIWVVFAAPICFALTLILWVARGIAWAAGKT